MNKLTVDIRTEDGRDWRTLTEAEQDALLENWINAIEQLMADSVIQSE